jgi:GAF domain-containing protein
MEPTPETSEALRALERYGDDAVSQELGSLGRSAREVIPELVGLSLCLVEEALTFTLVAEAELSRVDAMQYLEDGPCVTAVREGRVVPFTVDDVLDEDRWALFARASAAAGVRSSLSLPVIHDDVTVAGINLYASAPQAFEGHHDELAAALGGWSPGAVANADLPFRTRLEAAAAPVRIHEQDVVAQAVGALAGTRHVTPATALVLLQNAASRAGLTVYQVAQTFVDVMHGDE